MNLKLFFNPYTATLSLPQNSIGSSIVSLADDSFDIRTVDLALVGISENRGTADNRGVEQAADRIREKFYRLKRGPGTYKIADLGNLKSAPEPGASYDRLREVCTFLLESQVIPVIIGGSHDAFLGQYQAYEALEQLVTVLNVDARFDMEESGSANETFLTGILTHRPNYLFSYNHLAHQHYLVDAKTLSAIDKLYFELLRLGELRENPEKAEPLIRLADMMSFDITAIRSADAPANARAQPFGLTGEEACQICWYAGMNEKLNSISISEYNPLLDDGHFKTASVVSTMIWYFVEGFYNRKDNGDFDSENYMKYVVSMKDTDDTLVFYKSKLTDKWWMFVTYGSDHSEKAYIPCSYADYREATQGNFPERWIYTQGKLV